MKARALLALLLGCAPAAASREPPRYAPLPAAPTQSGPSFTPAAALVPIALACRGDESELANALDDDCDGKVDDRHTPSALTVALAHPRSATLRFALQSDDGSNTALPSPCEGDGPYCVLYVSVEALPKGGTLTVQAQQGAPASVLVSASAGARAHTYLLRIDAEAAQPIGRLAKP
jgi:hypothetical protein